LIAIHGSASEFLGCIEVVPLGSVAISPAKLGEARVSIAGLLPKGAGLLNDRPFRSPHHTISDAGLIGGGTGIARPRRSESCP